MATAAMILSTRLYPYPLGLIRRILIAMDETQAGPAAEADTTIVDPPPRDEPEQAWSTGDTAAEPRPYRHGRLVSAGLVVVVVLIVAAVVVLMVNFNRPSAPSAAPNTSHVEVPPPPGPIGVNAEPHPGAVAPPPPPPIVTAAPPSPPTPALSPKDSRFINALADQGLSAPNDRAIIADAQLVCTDMSQTISLANVGTRLRTLWPLIPDFQVAWFIDEASATYCPQFGGNV
jgi:hypothetical protein